MRKKDRGIERANVMSMTFSGNVKRKPKKKVISEEQEEK